MTHSPTMTSREEAEQYLPAEWTTAKFEPIEVPAGDTLKVVYKVAVKCLHCSNAAIASCLVEDSETVLQLVCADHIAGMILWRRSL